MDGHPKPAGRLGDFTADRRMLVVSAMAIVLGIVGALVAYGLLWLISVITNLVYHGRFSSTAASPAGTHLGLGAVLLPVGGGLVIGLMARYGSEKVRGHGIPEAMEAILIGQSKIQPRVAVLKPLSTAISIGTGGPFGAEGPIIVTGGAVGSLLGQFFHISAAERKTLLVAGAAAGMTATFGTPVAAVLIAVELLLFEWKPRSFVPVALACATAAAMRPLLFPSGSLFPKHLLPDPSGTMLASALGLGVLVGFGSAALTGIVYAFEDLFGRLRFHWMWWPAIGGLGIGIGGLIEPRALGVGYDNIRMMLDGRFVTTALLSLLIVKAIIWSFSLGSGTSGGVLAPLLIMGGAIGGLAAHVFGASDPGSWALIGMAAMIGGTMRAPLTAIVFSVELTRDLNGLLPLLIACTAAFAVTVLVMRRSILTEKVARRGHHVLREYSVDPLELTRAGQIMYHDVQPLTTQMTAAEALKVFASAQGSGRAHGGYPVVEMNGRVVGVLTRGDLIALDGDAAGTPVEEFMSSPAIVASPDEPVARVAERMALAGIGRIPIVNRDGTLVGIVSRRDLLQARAETTTSEGVRERVISPILGRRRGDRD
jgi:H+/Cl- antiporter ClcA